MLIRRYKIGNFISYNTSADHDTVPYSVILYGSKYFKNNRNDLEYTYR